MVSHGAMLRTFARRDDGGASFEACLWVPFLIGVILLVIDATFIFGREADAHRIAQDGTRQFVSGAIASQSELETWLETAMSPVSPNADANVSLDSTTGILTAVIEYPAEDTDLTGATGLLGAATVRVQSIQLTEE